MNNKLIKHRQGAFGECLAGTLHPAIRRTTADTAIHPCGCCGQGTRADRLSEKPSVAQSLATVIGATARKDGYLEGNGWRVSW